MAAGSGGMDWAALMRAGLRGLGLRPEEFWRLTPAELLLMLGSDERTAPLNRDRLEALSQLYPDKTD
ncbi:rcc01693 family protein [Falsihalocynthiibacter sp. SS001]|uniref:rcc01693 family protein n=1 Tax=Falsihalocynthiibacter sp. SS001 TaxID=3349698 RepID=UPI0036D33324